MKGAGNADIDSGTTALDHFLRWLARVGSWANAKADTRMYARREAHALPRGTRIRLNGQCCCVADLGRYARIHSYIVDTDDYRITFEDDPPRSANPIFDYHSYACINGFDIVFYGDGDEWFAARVAALVPEAPPPAGHRG